MRRGACPRMAVNLLQHTERFDLLVVGIVSSGRMIGPFGCSSRSSPSGGSNATAIPAIKKNPRSAKVRHAFRKYIQTTSKNGGAGVADCATNLEAHRPVLIRYALLNPSDSVRLPRAEQHGNQPVIGSVPPPPQRQRHRPERTRLAPCCPQLIVRDLLPRRNRSRNSPVPVPTGVHPTPIQSPVPLDKTP
jgi:hypothetical protein